MNVTEQSIWLLSITSNVILSKSVKDMRSNTFTVTRVSCMTHSPQSFLLFSTWLHVSLIFNLTIFHFSFFQSLVHISPSPIPAFFPWSRFLSAHPESPHSPTRSWSQQYLQILHFFAHTWPLFGPTDWPSTQPFLSSPVHLPLLTFSSSLFALILFSSHQNNISSFNWKTSLPIFSNFSTLQSADHMNLLLEVLDSLLSLQGWPSSCSLETYLDLLLLESTLIHLGFNKGAILKLNQREKTIE